MGIYSYGNHLDKTNIQDDKLLMRYLDIVNKNRTYPIVVRQEFHFEKGLFGSSKHSWYNVFTDMGDGERQHLYSCVKREIVEAYLWGNVHGIEVT